MGTRDNGVRENVVQQRRATPALNIQSGGESEAAESTRTKNQEAAGKVIIRSSLLTSAGDNG